MSNYEIQYFESRIYSHIYIKFIPQAKYGAKSGRISVNLLLFDGMSRIAFNYQFNRTKNYILSLAKDFIILDMLRYHTIGMNSRPNFVPLFYGKKYQKKPNIV